MTFWDKKWKDSDVEPQSGGLNSGLMLFPCILKILSKHRNNQDLYAKSFLDNVLTVHHFLLMMNIIIFLCVGGT